MKSPRYTRSFPPHILKSLALANMSGGFFMLLSLPFKGELAMQWEYEIQNFGICNEDDGMKDAHQVLNEMGTEEWEIIAILPDTTVSHPTKGTLNLLAFAKRPYPH
jgi:hypothetical protein